MNGAEVRRLDDRQLVESLVEKKEELFNLRFQRATGQLENTARITRTKRDIARLRTVLREREIAAADALVAGEAR